MRNSGAGCRWLPGQIVEKTGPISFRVLLEDGRGKRCHQDQLRARVVDERGTDSPPGDLSSSTPVPGPSFSDDVPPILGPSEAAQPNSSAASSSSESNTTDRTSSSSVSNTPDRSAETSVRRYPQRERRPREHFESGTG